MSSIWIARAYAAQFDSARLFSAMKVNYNVGLLHPREQHNYCMHAAGGQTDSTN